MRAPPGVLFSLVDSTPLEPRSGGPYSVKSRVGEHSQKMISYVTVTLLNNKVSTVIWVLTGLGRRIISLTRPNTSMGGKIHRISLKVQIPFWPSGYWLREWTYD